MLNAILPRAVFWLGVGGLIVSLFANLRSPLAMADSVWWFVEKWQDMTQTAWQMFLTTLGLEATPELFSALNVAVFFLVTAAGVRLRDDRTDPFQPIRRPGFVLLAAGAALSTIAYIALIASPLPLADRSASNSVPTLIFLGASAVSFFPIAGKANLTKALWLTLSGLLTVVAINEIAASGVPS